MLRSDLCHYSDAYIAVKGDIVLTKSNGRRAIYIRNKFLVFKNNASFTNCISKINNVLIDNEEDLDIVMAICLNTVKIIEKQQEVFGIITEVNLIILLLMMTTLLLIITMQALKQVLNLLNTNVVLQEKHQMQIMALSEKIERLKNILKLLLH